MTKTRYFKATNGQFTIFRASTSRIYAYADLTPRDGEVVMMGFGNLKGALRAEEINKAEYEALVALKTARIKACNEAKIAAGQPVWAPMGPRDSWVSNVDLTP